MATITAKSFELSVDVDALGLRHVDPFELIYFIRTGVQQCLTDADVVISNIGVSAMPGYVMVWDTVRCTPVTRLYLPNNDLKDLTYQEFKFSEFYQMLLHAQSNKSLFSPNLALNLWGIMKQGDISFSEDRVISSVDTWVSYILSGYNESTLVTNATMMGELVGPGGGWDDALLRAIGLQSHILPQLAPIDAAASMRFSPLPDGIPINYSTSTNDLLFRMMDAFGSEPMACVHLSSVNHLYLNRLIRLGDESEVWVRFAGLQSLRQAFNLPSHLTVPEVQLADVQDELLIPTDPFRSFFHQTYHLMNMRLFSPEMMVKLGVVLHLFLIKFIISKYEPLTAHGHIKTLIFSSSEWDQKTLQTCIDICQLDGVEFKIPHWLDMVHIHALSHLGEFFSLSEQQRLFKVQQRLIPSLDPLSCYSLYQPWEDWFNKLYDTWN